MICSLYCFCVPFYEMNKLFCKKKSHVSIYLIICNAYFLDTIQEWIDGIVLKLQTLSFWQYYN